MFKKGDLAIVIKDAGRIANKGDIVEIIDYCPRSETYTVKAHSGNFVGGMEVGFEEDELDTIVFDDFGDYDLELDNEEIPPVPREDEEYIKEKDVYCWCSSPTLIINTANGNDFQVCTGCKREYYERKR